MGLLSFFKQRGQGDPARPPAAAPDPDALRVARTRARRRLVGAIVLLGIGVIAFPLVLETQPRPIPVDLPIDIPRRDALPPLAQPSGAMPKPARAASAVAALVPAAAPPSAPALPGDEGAPAAPAAASAPAVAAPAPAAASSPASRPARSTPPEPARAAAPPSPAVPQKPAAPSTPAAARVASAPSATAPKPAEPASGRWVVQVGAFAEVTKAREARLKVEGMGLKTYTQVVQASDGRRIRVRVGPYEDKAEAERAAARIKAGGLPTALLLL